MTYNLHKGFDILNRNFVLERMREMIREVHADIVFLQEARGGQYEFLADSIWEHFAYGKNAIVDDDNHHGNAILSKFPILQFENVNLSTNRFEKRGLLHGVIEMPGTKKRIHLFNTHLNLLESGRAIQLKKIIEHISKNVSANEAVILCGDFNDWGMKASELLHETLGLKDSGLTIHRKHLKTFPSIKPMLCLDRAYIRGIEISKAAVLNHSPWNDLSDHLCILVDLSV